MGGSVYEYGYRGLSFGKFHSRDGVGGGTWGKAKYQDVTSFSLGLFRLSRGESPNILPREGW